MVQLELNLCVQFVILYFLQPNKETMCHTGAYCTIPWMNGYCRNMFVMDGTDCGNAGENKVVKYLTKNVNI